MNIDREPQKKIFEGQLFHLLGLVILLIAAWYVSRFEPVMEGELLGISTATWYRITLITAILHQGYVWLCWRIELYYGWLTRNLGEKAFTVYRILFSILGLSRFVIIALAVSNRGAMNLHDLFQWAVPLLFLLLAGYTFYSVIVYFGIDRAAGLDHFEDSASSWEFVRGGIFQYSSNAMYLFGFLIFWIPGLMLQSPAALAAAAYFHIYIWVHYYCTELPDMREIYGAT